VAGNAAQEVIADLQVIRALAAGPAPLAGARAAGRQLETDIKLILSRKQHPAGTRTPSAPGEPPARISGDLANSVEAVFYQVDAGVAVALISPDTVYAVIQEYGGTITAKNFPQLGNPLRGWFGPSVRLPARPYMALALAEALAAGTLAQSAERAFTVTLGF
jgi:phage gpG-like protein